MSVSKICPQCGNEFEGRSNQLYCGSSCKQRSFQEGKTQASPDSQTSPEPPSSLKAPRSVSSSDSRNQLKLEALKIQSAERMRQLEMEERDRERVYDRQLKERQFQQDLHLANLNSKAALKTADQEKEQLQLKLSELSQQVKKLSEAEAAEPVVEEPKVRSKNKAKKTPEYGWLASLFIGGALLYQATINAKEEAAKTNIPPKKPLLNLQKPPAPRTLSVQNGLDTDF